MVDSSGKELYTKEEVKWVKRISLSRKLKLAQNGFSYDEAVNLLCSFGYEVSNKGKTSGSRVVFKCKGRAAIYLHKPHPQKERKPYQIRQIKDILEQEDLI